MNDKFWRRVTKTDSCWEWNGSKNRKGYGMFAGPDGTTLYAHRFSYAQRFGTIADGFQIDHLCKNTSCVRPDHLESVTPAVNNARSNSPTAINARKAECKHGHMFDEENTYRPPSGGRYCRTCVNARTRAYRRKKALRRALDGGEQ